MTEGLFIYYFFASPVTLLEYVSVLAFLSQFSQVHAVPFQYIVLLLYCIFSCKIYCNFNFQKVFLNYCYFCSVFFLCFYFSRPLLYINWIFFITIQYFFPVS